MKGMREQQFAGIDLHRRRCVILRTMARVAA